LPVAFEILGKRCEIGERLVDLNGVSRPRSSAPPPRNLRARLVKLGIAIGAQAEGAVRSHARRALAEQMRPSAMSAYSP
jgi:hypothetical protein